MCRVACHPLSAARLHLVAAAHAETGIEWEGYGTTGARYLEPLATIQAELGVHRILSIAV